jgi:hypothetical protein
MKLLFEFRRRTALKEMLQAYGEYEAIMKVEKDWLKAVQTRIESEIEDGKNNNASSLDNLNVLMFYHRLFILNALLQTLFFCCFV